MFPTRSETRQKITVNAQSENILDIIIVFVYTCFQFAVLFAGNSVAIFLTNCILITIAPGSYVLQFSLDIEVPESVSLADDPVRNIINMEALDNQVPDLNVTDVTIEGMWSITR